MNPFSYLKDYVGRGSGNRIGSDSPGCLHRLFAGRATAGGFFGCDLQDGRLCRSLYAVPKAHVHRLRAALIATFSRPHSPTIQRVGLSGLSGASPSQSCDDGKVFHMTSSLLFAFRRRTASRSHVSVSSSGDFSAPARPGDRLRLPSPFRQKIRRITRV